MRPLRLVLLLSFFVALPIFLTCLSLLSNHDKGADSFSHQPQSRLRALFSFHTPSSLFPPSAIISLTYDNSTFFLARPAAFGPSLPSKGLSGQLWVGRGFGDDSLHKDGFIHVNGWELGCSDVPGWGEDDKTRPDQPGSLENSQAKSIGDSSAVSADVNAKDIKRTSTEKLLDGKRDSSEDDASATQEDGTDDHLHHPLPDSNPARAAKPGEPADHDSLANKARKSTHADIQSLQESADIAGKIVMLSRGGCGFLEKVKWAQRRGGIALIVGDNERGAQLTIMYAKGDTSNVTIPALFTSYTSAHLLSSLVPPEHEEIEGTAKEHGDPKTGGRKKVKSNINDDGPKFTSVDTASTMRPTIIPANSKQSTIGGQKGWARNMLSAFGLGPDSTHHWQRVEDSRRPPSSGNIDWVLVENWDETEKKQPVIKGKIALSTKASTTSTISTKCSSLSPKRPTGDDFVIGVQDWRDADMLAPKSTSSLKSGQGAGDGGGAGQQRSNSARIQKSIETGVLKGGSITPGSGEYDSQNIDDSRSGHRTRQKGKGQKSQLSSDQKESPDGWFKAWKSSQSIHDEDNGAERQPKDQANNGKTRKVGTADSKTDPPEDEPEGLWVTLTPTSVSASPFFDTLLVLVVSPLVTLTVVYALLLLRSRIRRRRWRAPKSVVDRLPVRTYHTISTSSSTTSSQIASPDQPSPTSPLLRSSPQDISSRPRPRSQTTTGIPSSATVASSHLHPTNSPLPSLRTEKPASKPTKRKRYTGRQVECVVCLEEYVDGESRVMSLPCGHEFHADCITPWLVTRRRTCPICKGDVVRSMARNGGRGDDDDMREEGEETADDVQDRAAETVNSSPSAAIPIPILSDTGLEDVERGENETAEEGRRTEAEQERGPAPRSSWRNLVSSSVVSALSGDTLWRSTQVDRSR